MGVIGQLYVHETFNNKVIKHQKNNKIKNTIKR